MSLPADSSNTTSAAVTIMSSKTNGERVGEKVETSPNPMATAPADDSRESSPAEDEVILATAGYDHCIKFWTAHTGKCMGTLQHPDSQVNAMEISPDGQLLAACGYQHIRMFDVHNTKPNPVVNFEGVSKNVMAVGFQEEGRWMYTGGEDGTVKIWDLRMRNLQCQRIFQAGNIVNSVKLHPNQQEVLVGDAAGNVHVWNLSSENHQSILHEKDSSIQSVDIDAAGNMIAAITNKGTCYMSVFPNSGSEEFPRSNAIEAAILPLGDDATTTAEDWTLNQMFKPETKTSKINAHKKYGLKCKFSPDSKFLVTTSADHTAKLWDTSNQEYISEMTVEGQRWVWDVAFSADSQYMFTASSDGVARLWSIPAKPEVKRTYKENGHTKAVTCLAFRDGTSMGK